MRRKKSLAAVLCALAVLWSVGAAEYHLSPTGNDTDQGSRERPWRTIERANRALRAGDTAIFHPGEYAGCIDPEFSGEAGKPLVYRSETPGAAILTGGGIPRGNRPNDYPYARPLAAAIDGKEYVEIDGFSFRCDKFSRWFRVSDSEYCTVKRCDFDNTRTYFPVVTENIRFCRFEDLRLERVCNLQPDSSAEVGFVHGDLWLNKNVRGSVYYRVRTAKVGHSPINFDMNCVDNVLRECVFVGLWGRPFEFFSPGALLVERCIITNATKGSGSADGSGKVFADNLIFRRNLIFNNYHGPTAAELYPDKRPAPNGEPMFFLLNSRFYFNTWTRNHDFAFLLNGWRPEAARNNVFKNNIFAGNNPGGAPLSLLQADNTGRDTLYICNLLYGTKPGGKTIGITYPKRLFWTAEEANAARPEQYQRNFDADPGFVDPASGDFRLKPGSAAIDRAEPLTVTRSAGRGTKVPVADARYFYDGFGIPGETGDAILVGAENVRVVKCDREENELTVDREIAWTEGAPVQFPFTGRAPDPGAYEAGMATGPAAAADLLPRPVGDTLISCDFEPDTLESWHFLWNFTRRPNSYMEVVATPAPKGKYSGRVFHKPGANKDAGSVLETYIRPYIWDIDRHPLVTFDYRIPAGTPVGLSLWTFRSPDYPDMQVLIGGTASRDANQLPDLDAYKLVDDGQWHTIAVDARVIRKLYPEIKLLQRFQFGTPGANARPGAEFYFDNFRIHASPEK